MLTCASLVTSQVSHHTDDEDEVLLLPGATFLIERDGVTLYDGGITEVRAAELDIGRAKLCDTVQGGGNIYSDKIGLALTRTRRNGNGEKQSVFLNVEQSSGAGISNQERCGKCNAKPQFCACNMRRTSRDMSTIRFCKQQTANGPCTNPALLKSTLCGAHTCGKVKCKHPKSSSAVFCEKHAAADEKRLSSIDPDAPVVAAYVGAVYEEPIEAVGTTVHVNVVQAADIVL